MAEAYPFAEGDSCPACMAAGVVNVHLHGDPTPEPGVWCPTCMLPSAFTIRPEVRCCHGWPLTVIVLPLTWCPECEQQATTTT